MAPPPSLDGQRTTSQSVRSPRVTVLVTLYNKGPWVETALQSILGQTFSDFELLVVDDASTDGGLEAVKAMGDPRIGLLESRTNTGRAAAANRGLEAARGEYVAVLDADDLMLPDRLAKQVAYMDAHPEVVACGTWGEAIGAGGGKLIRMPTDDEGCRAVMLFGMPVQYPSVMLRRAILEAHALRCRPDWRLPGMDYLFMLEVGRHGAYANLPEVLFQYRTGGNNMRHGRDKLLDRRALVRETFDFFGIQATENQREVHMGLHNVWGHRQRAHDVGALWQWKSDLARQNRDRGLFPVPGFEAEMDRLWARLFHYYADQTLDAGLAHMRLSKSWPPAHLSYLAKTTLRRWASGAGPRA